MTELEQLRKEVNELRERLAKLEARPVVTQPLPGLPWVPNFSRTPQPQPFVIQPGDFPPGTVVC